jgi:hypothetical protein
MALVAFTIHVVANYIDLAVGQGLRVDGLSLDLNGHHVGECEQTEVLALLKANAVHELLEVLLQEDLLDLVQVVD